MRTQTTIGRGPLLTLLCGVWLLSLTAPSAQAVDATVDPLKGTFTIAGFEVVNGRTEALGVLTADDVITNVPVRLPVLLGGSLAGKASLLASLSPAGITEFIPPPTLSTNLCTILAISIEFVDVTIPGLGLNVHLNQILLGVRADRETRLGDVLCTLLGEDAYLDAGPNSVSNGPSLSIAVQNNQVMLSAKGPGTLQSTTNLMEPTPWRDVLALGTTAQTLMPTAAMEFFRVLTGQASRGGFSLGGVNGVFTVGDLKNINGVSMAAGWLSGNVSDPMGISEVGMFTNFPVRLPITGVLEGNPVDANFVEDPVILPQLSTNTCALLGVVVGAIDVTIPGLGLNVHLNQISLVVRADRETTVGDLLCTLLGDDLLGAASIGPMPATVAAADSTKTKLSPDQLRSLADIVLLPALVGRTDSTTAQSLSTVSTTSTKSGKHPKKGSGEQELVQHLLQRAIATIMPASLPKAKGK